MWVPRPGRAARVNLSFYLTLQISVPISFPLEFLCPLFFFSSQFSSSLLFTFTCSVHLSIYLSINCHGLHSSTKEVSIHSHIRISKSKIYDWDYKTHTWTLSSTYNSSYCGDHPQKTIWHMLQLGLIDFPDGSWWSLSGPLWWWWLHLFVRAKSTLHTVPKVDHAGKAYQSWAYSL